MIIEERQSEILELLNSQRKKIVTVKQICQKCFISESSARRDLRKLEDEGLIKRLHGGAKLIEYDAGDETPAPETGVAAAGDADAPLDRIAREAVNFIREGDTLFIDSGNASSFLARHLSGFRTLTVITSGLANALAISRIQGICVIAVGGAVGASGGTQGADACEIIDGFSADVAFISCHSFDAHSGASDFSREEASVKKKMIQRAKKTVLLCPAGGIGRVSPFVICRAGSAECIITDASLSAQSAESLMTNSTPFRCV